MYFYRAFGVDIASEIEIPQFTNAQIRQNQFSDVSIVFGAVKNLLPERRETDRATQIGDQEILFFWEKIGAFLVRGGSEIIVERDAEAEDALVRLPLVGIALAALLHQRGMLVLHASAVAINDQAVVFVGGKGKGKSTTAAALYERGHKMISDDIAAIRVAADNSLRVAPGFPNFKLAPETAATIFGDDPRLLPAVCSGVEKRYRSAANNFLQKDAPLAAVYALEDGETPEMQRLKPQEAVTTLIAHTYLARYGKQLLQNRHAIENLRLCAKVAVQVPVRRLERPRSLEQLADLARLLETKHNIKAVA